MASLFKRKNGTREIQFTDLDGNRQTVRLGRCSQRAANRAQSCIEDLLSSRKLDESPKDNTRKWLRDIDAKLHSRLASFGLVEHREIAKLGPFIERYIAGRADLKPPTIRKFNVTKDYLVKKFAADMDMHRITEGHAEDFRIFLLGQKTGRMDMDTMGENTCRKHCQIAGQFFNRAVKLRLIDRNPFRELPSTVQRNHSRDHYIDQATIEKVLAVCPDDQWRLIFGLARFAGLRCPSEILDLRWTDIHWADEDMVVRSAKTEHHIGKAQRIVPIFSDLLPLLQDSFELAEDGAEYVITRYRHDSVNLRTQAHRIIKRAGYTPWKKCFQNLPSSLATDLVQFIPLHQTAEWTGHSIETMRKFYLQITREHREQAKLRQRARIEAQQKSQQTGADMGGNAAPDEGGSLVFSIKDLPCPIPLMGDEGLEPPTSSV